MKHGYINLYWHRLSKSLHIHEHAKKSQHWSFPQEPPSLANPHLAPWPVLFEPPSTSFLFRVGKNIAKMSFWKRRTANITDYDPTYRVVYLGNVLTGWAKGKNASQIHKYTIYNKIQYTNIPTGWVKGKKGSHIGGGIYRQERKSFSDRDAAQLSQCVSQICCFLLWEIGNLCGSNRG